MKRTKYIQEIDRDIPVELRDDAMRPRHISADVPQWFISSMKKLSPGNRRWKAKLPGGDGEAAVMVFGELGFHDYSWFDHAGWVDEDLVSEPYLLRAEGAAALKCFCEQTGTEFAISGSSFHYPTMTLRITVRQKDESAKVIPTMEAS